MTSSGETILTTPHMGHFCDLLAFLFRRMGCKFLVPPPPSPHSRQTGRKLGREGFCQPLNNCLADIYAGIEAGANAVVVTVGEDACRYGFYWANQKSILEEHFEREIPFYPIHHLSPRESVLDALRKVGGNPDPVLLKRVWALLYAKVEALQHLNRAANRARARRADRLQVAALAQSAMDSVLSADSVNGIEETSEAGWEAISALIPDPTYTPLRVLLVGPIYEVLEPEANYSIEEFLGSLGVEVERSLKYHDLLPYLTDRGERAHERYEEMLTGHASRFINPLLAEHGFGGYGRMTIGHAARAKAHDFDGIVHVHSFSCMPEIVSKPFIKRISVEDDIPAISIVVEEIGARELIYNRLEAFVDLIRERDRVDVERGKQP